MHFIVSWDIQSKDEKWDEINAQLQECLEELLLGTTSQHFLHRQSIRSGRMGKDQGRSSSRSREFYC